MPTIAALDGAALGGGLEMALASDIIVAGNVSVQILSQNETCLSRLPDTNHKHISLSHGFLDYTVIWSIAKRIHNILPI